MKTFYNFTKNNFTKIMNFLNEKFGDEETILFYISGYDKYRYLKQKEADKPGDIMVAYEKIKLDLSKDSYTSENLFNVLSSYNPTTNKKDLYSVKYKVTNVRFLIYKIDSTLHIFTFDGDILHRNMAFYLNEKNKIKSLNIEYLKIYDDYYDYGNLTSIDFNLKTKDWCLPLATKNFNEYFMDEKQYIIYLAEEIYKYFGVTEDEFDKKIGIY